nr:hypothetical protein [Tanacetum cinerariifolium]
DRHGLDRRGGGNNHRSSNNNYFGNNNRNSGNERDQRNRVSSPTDLSILVFSSPGVPLRATPTRSALCVDADTQESVVELLVPASKGRYTELASAGLIVGFVTVVTRGVVFAITLALLRITFSTRDPAQRMETPLALPWERIPRLDSGVRIRM